MAGPFVVHKRFNLTAPPAEEFDVIEISDAYLTHSCSNYVNDGTTVPPIASTLSQTTHSTALSSAGPRRIGEGLAGGRPGGPEQE